MANGDQPVVGGAREMFKIKVPAGATKTADGHFEVTPTAPITSIVMNGPDPNVAEKKIIFRNNPDGSVSAVWQIPPGTLWNISIE